ncbi:hypothetical protein [Heyndrickxia ginsengihumi]|uniref:hypothetical protein n=1 Tax=Heyndrickxia ginsengihumi TaxID=363870 RepID=UPI003D2106F5
MRQTKPVRIGILGEIRAGKDTVSQIISHELSKLDGSRETNFFAFANGIHEVIKVTMPEVYSLGKPRKELQHIGQALRQIKPDVWIDMLFNSQEYIWAKNFGHNLLITDVRQPNEAKRLQEQGFKIIKVTAFQHIRMQRAIDSGDNFNPDAFNHETELVINQCPYDYEINNSFSIDFLESSVLRILGEVVK